MLNPPVRMLTPIETLERSGALQLVRDQSVSAYSLGRCVTLSKLPNFPGKSVSPRIKWEKG